MTKSILAACCVLLVCCTASLFSYTLLDALQGVERLAFAEYGVPYFQWVNELSVSAGGGYDLRDSQAVVSGSLEARLFEDLRFRGQVYVETDFASATDFLLDLGVEYTFAGGQQKSKELFFSASHKALLRKIQVVHEYFDFLSEKALLELGPVEAGSKAGTLQELEHRLGEVDLAYRLVLLETLSGISQGDPQLLVLDQLLVQQIPSELVDLAVLNVLNVKRAAENHETPSKWVGLFRSGIGPQGNTFFGGVGGWFDFEPMVSRNVEESLEEVDIRRLKLRHGVLGEYLPPLMEELQALLQQKNRMTLEIVQGKADAMDVERVNESIRELQAARIRYTYEAVKIQVLFEVMAGTFTGLHFGVAP